MSQAPEYRLRLFLSVDLVGSTAFKAAEKYSDSDGTDPSPAWVATFRDFYTEFQKFLETSYNDELRISYEFGSPADQETQSPLIWKTVGDEIIFCTRVFSIEHLAVNISAFVKSIDKYSQKLKLDKMPLNVKGACWIAAFPAPNATIEVITKRDLPKQGVEIAQSRSPESVREDLADGSPHLFDFLGKGIDTGFRVAKNATEDRCMVSVQLAYLLAKAKIKKRFHHSVGYAGRESLKGVVNGIPYPVVYVDTERNELNWMLRSREAALRGERAIDEYALCDFLMTFMEVANIEPPCLKFRDDESVLSNPPSYMSYVNQFYQNQTIDNERLNDLVSDKNALGGDEPAGALDDAEAFFDTVAPEVDVEAQSEGGV